MVVKTNIISLHFISPLGSHVVIFCGLLWEGVLANIGEGAIMITQTMFPLKK
jgi:hypothetical protein